MTSGVAAGATSLMGTLVTLVLAGVLAAKVAQWIKIPDVVLFLLVGIVIGPPVLGLVNMGGQSVASQLIFSFGSALILFDGGMGLDLKVLKKMWRTITLLATLGVLVTAAVTGLAARIFLGLPPAPALLLAAVIASTDPATLVPVFKQVRIRERVSQTVLAESAFNDATGAILTFSLLGMLSAGTFSAGRSVMIFGTMVGFGLMAGLAVGFAISYLVAHHKIGIFGPYSAVMVVVAVLSSYLLAERIGGSGYMAVFTAGIIMGNMPSFKLVHHDQYAMEQHYFLNNVALIMRMMIFILLGTQVNFAVMEKYWPAGLLVTAVLMLLARPLTVLSSALPDRSVRWQGKELLFMFWVRETGVIPAALSGLLISAGVPYADVIAAITFMVILVTILVQAGTTRLVAQKLGLLLEK